MGDSGTRAIKLAGRIFGAPTSITGPGVTEVLEILSSDLADLTIREIPSGSRAFDWTLPPEWILRTARLTTPDGTVIADAKRSPLEVVGFSTGVDATLDLEELKPHLHSLPDRPHAVPYRTSYYERTWGFCLKDEVLQDLPQGEYHAFIDAEHRDDGVFRYGEVVIGDGPEEVVVSAHLCHPSQANDNISGVITAAGIAATVDPRRLRVRFLFLPGGIGSLAWLSQNDVSNIEAGLTLACVGDEAPLTYKRTRREGTVIDRAADLVAGELGIDLHTSPFEPYGFDERNFSSPGFNLPFGSLTRAGHGGYPEYHSSDDDLSLLDPDRIGEAISFATRLIEVLDANHLPVRVDGRGEPQLGRRGLYGSLGGLQGRKEIEMALLWVANLADGDHDLIAMANRSGLPFEAISQAADLLKSHGVNR